MSIDLSKFVPGTESFGLEEERFDGNDIDVIVMGTELEHEFTELKLYTDLLCERANTFNKLHTYSLKHDNFDGIKEVIDVASYVGGTESFSDEIFVVGQEAIGEGIKKIIDWLITLWNKFILWIKGFFAKAGLEKKANEILKKANVFKGYPFKASVSSTSADNPTLAKMAKAGFDAILVRIDDIMKNGDTDEGYKGFDAHISEADSPEAKNAASKFYVLKEKSFASFSDVKAYVKALLADVKTTSDSAAAVNNRLKKIKSAKNPDARLLNTVSKLSQHLTREIAMQFKLSLRSLNKIEDAIGTGPKEAGSVFNDYMEKKYASE